MSHSHHRLGEPSQDTRSKTSHRRTTRLVFWGFLGIAVYYLLTEHRAHLIQGASWLPWLLLLVCPFMHVFMHRGHGNHDGHGGSKGTDAAGDAPPATPTLDSPAAADPRRPRSPGGWLP